MIGPHNKVEYTDGMKVIRKLYNPSIFQGSLNKKGYFEGWYFKQVSADLEHAYAFIPGVALDKEKYIFIQIIDGRSGTTHFITYPLEEFSASDRYFEVRVGNSRFSDKCIDLDIDAPDIRVKGCIEFDNLSLYPSRFFSPGIMGPYSFIPGMECKHGVVSMDHGLKGELLMDNKSVDFTGGRGYIEKDWGASFPESWIWMQSNNFSTIQTSFMLSIAKIPWMGSSFIGFLSFLKCNGDVRFFTSYNGSEITKLENLSRRDNNNSEGVSLRINRGRESISVNAESTRRGALKSPVKGRMESYIKESVDAEITFEYHQDNGEVIRDKGCRGGLEIVEDIFDRF